MSGDAEKDPKTSIVEHRFLDEAGDTTFYGKGGQLILGANGVSSTFSIGMVIREKISLVVDLYDAAKYEGWMNYYDPKKNPLTAANKISPHSA